MSARIRLVLAVAIVRRSPRWRGRRTPDASRPPIAATLSDRPVATFDLSRCSARNDGRRVIETAYEQVEHSYYEPVDPQLMVDGETKALNAYPERQEGSRRAALVRRSRDRRVGPRSGAAGADGRRRRAPLPGRRDAAANSPRSRSAGCWAASATPTRRILSADAMRALDEELKGGNFGGIGVYIGKDPEDRRDRRRPDRGQSRRFAPACGPATSIVAVNDAADRAARRSTTSSALIRGPARNRRRAARFDTPCRAARCERSA